MRIYSAAIEAGARSKEWEWSDLGHSCVVEPHDGTKHKVFYRWLLQIYTSETQILFEKLQVAEDVPIRNLDTVPLCRWYVANPR